MGKARKVYPAEFKREAVGLTKQPNATVEGVARDLGVSSSALHKWARAEKEAGALAFPGQGKQALTTEQSEIERLKKELALVREEREILKKATAYFAKESR
jgi:transposase